MSVVAACVFACSGRAIDAQEPPRTFDQGVLVRLEGVITPLMEQFLVRKLRLARDRGADLLILEIDSPGGFTATTLSMADRVQQIDWATTVAFVPQQAISGGAILCLGCDELVMAPQARLGDAGEIMMGDDNAFRYVPEKQRSVLARQVRDLAEATGRPPALAEAMVNMDLVVYKVRNEDTGKESYLSDSEIASLADGDRWQKLEPVLESREKHFLTVNGTRAVELQLAQATAGSRDELQVNLAVDDVIVLEPTTVDLAVIILNFPLVTGLIFLIGMIALFVEFYAPGLGVGGPISGLCFSLFFWSRFLGGTAGWLEVILFAAGVIFVAMEFFVIPGFGIAGLSGLTLIVSSMLMASQHFVIPSTQREMAVTVNGLTVIVGSGLAFLVSAVAFSRYVGSLPIFNWLVLPAPAAARPAGDEGKNAQALTTSPARAPFPVDVGDWGVADSPLRPAGKTRFGKAYVDVVTDGTFVDQGRQVSVIQISGNRVVVREVEE